MDSKAQQFLTQLLPPRKRADVRAILEGCTLIRQAILSPGCCSGGNGGLNRLPPMLDDAVTRNQISRDAVQEFLDACTADAATKRYATWKALRRHCEGVGGNVAVMIASVLGVTHSDAAAKAVAVGAAIRLTSILRQLKRDLAEERIYLPLEDLARQRVSQRALLELPASDERIDRIVWTSVERARALLRAGGEGLQWVAGDGSRAAAGLMITLTAATLDDIDRMGSKVLHKPPRTSALRVLRRAGDAWRMARTS